MKDFVNRKALTATKKTVNRTIGRTLNQCLWLAVIAIISIVVFASMYFQVFKDYSALMAALIIVGLVVMLVVARYTHQGEKGWQFVLGARTEMRKVVFPTRQETINSTLIVLTIVIISSLIIYFIGLFFMHLIQAILG